MRASGLHINVETKTALLKGYAHAGKVEKAEALFDSMCQERGKFNVYQFRFATLDETHTYEKQE